MAVLFVVVGLAGCAGSAAPEIGYKPPVLPVSLRLDESGVHVVGDKSLITPFGEISIGGDYTLPKPPQGDLYIILRNRRTGFDTTYEVKSGGDRFDAVVNGKTDISITNDQVTIDVTDGNINQISFKRAVETISEQAPAESWPVRTWHTIESRWNQGWNESWYKPYSMARWAYSDSTITKWYGMGFIWFLLRLALAVVLGVIDTVLTVFFLLGQVAFMIFGPIGRNIVYGLSVLGFIAIVVVGAVAARA